MRSAAATAGQQSSLMQSGDRSTGARSMDTQSEATRKSGCVYKLNV